MYALVPCELCLIPVRIRLQLLDVVSFLVEVDQFAAPLVNLLAHFRKLSLVSVERDEHLRFNSLLFQIEKITFVPTPPICHNSALAI